MASTQSGHQTLHTLASASLLAPCRSKALNESMNTSTKPLEIRSVVLLRDENSTVLRFQATQKMVVAHTPSSVRQVCHALGGVRRNDATATSSSPSSSSRTHSVSLPESAHAIASQAPATVILAAARGSRTISRSCRLMLSIQASLLAPREVSVNQAHLSMSTGKKSATNRRVPASKPLAWKAASHAWAAATVSASCRESSDGSLSSTAT